jgi:flagellar biosynthesis/type III secretory pathway protein FliH
LPGKSKIEYNKGYDTAEREYKEKMKLEGVVEQYAEGYKEGFRDGYLEAMKSISETNAKIVEEEGIEPITWPPWLPWPRR